METLFTYGTLSSASVRRGLLGRDVEASPATLSGWIKSIIRIGSTMYPAIVPETAGKVVGLVFEVSKNELKKIDEYETRAYLRRKVVLNDGRSAWVYVRA